MNNIQKNKNEIILDKDFWSYRWENGLTGWDIGAASPAIVTYFEQYPNKDAAILIPGCGSAYEADYLTEKGFTNITLLDIAPKAVETLKERFANEKVVNVICNDFFEHKGKYDLIVEQTFFCTMPHHKRGEYAQKMISLLKDNGKVIGLMFDTVFEHQGPPYGGTAEEYQKVFEPYFKIRNLSKCYNSIPPRAGNEVFINFIKK